VAFPVHLVHEDLHVPEVLRLSVQKIVVCIAAIVQAKILRWRLPSGIECLHDRARGLCICHDVKAHALAALHAPVHHAARYKLLMLLLPLITVSLHPGCCALKT
jgi:hypothetical protein